MRFTFFKFIVLASLGLLLISFAQEEERVSWSEDFRFTWADFKATPKPWSSATAITASGLSYGLSINIVDGKQSLGSYSVDCYFYPNSSWVKKGLANNVVLAHEQLHFDITELHARKLRKQIQEHDFGDSKIKAQFSDLYKAMTKTVYNAQESYDLDADYSRNFERQLFWQDSIAIALQKLEDYKTVVE